MRARVLIILTTVVALGFVSGCGTPGVPLPPSLNLPKPVDDLQAERHGNKVQLTFTMPTVTTDEQGIHSMGQAKVCRGVESTGGCRELVTAIPLQSAMLGKKLKAEDDLTAALQNPGGRDFLVYFVELTNASGRTAGPSNSATVFLAPGMPPPAAVTAKLEPDAIVLQWNSPPLPESGKLRTQYFYKVVRQADGEQQPNLLQVLPATPGAMSFRDTQFEWEKTYSYQIVGVTRVVSLEGALLSEFEGEPSAEARIVAHDVFPPAAPTDVQAVFTEVAGRRFIDVTWSPSPSSDVAGYNLYRQRTDGSWQRLNPQLITTPSFRDEAVQPGNTYTYKATAVDARGNESTPSAPEQEKVPE